MTDHMNCGFCCTRHPIEAMGEHGWGICGKVPGSTVQFGGQWVLENWNHHLENHDGWQDVIEDITESLFPEQYGGILASHEEITERDEDVMMKAEERAEQAIILDFIARFCFQKNITTDQIAKKMEENE